MAERRTTRQDDRRRPTRQSDAPTRRADAPSRRADAPSRRTQTQTSSARRERSARGRADTGPNLRLIGLAVAAVALIGLFVFGVSACMRSCSGDKGEPAAQTTTVDATDAQDSGSASQEADTGNATENSGASGESATTQTTEPEEKPLSASSEAAIENPSAFKRILLTSTPRDQWSGGDVPLILQKDPQWATVKYADGVIGTHGCGPVCLSMAYVYLTGDTSMDPIAMCAFSEENGYVEAGVTGWRLMDEGAWQLGLTVHPVLTEVSGLRQALESGQILIQDCDPGDFTEHGHFILICGIDENDQLTIRDPNSWRNTQQTWDAQRVLDQHRNIWGFTYDG